MPKALAKFAYLLYNYSIIVLCIFWGEDMTYQGIAPAKVNLSLDILGRRPDGYHLLKSVMQTVSLCDVVEVELAKTTRVTATDQALPCDETNLAWRAYQLMREEFKLDAGVNIRLAKQIPLCGGLAGGSTNAAQVLLAINSLFELNLTTERLQALAARLGADVPFCLSGGTVLAEGAGEKLTPLEPCPELRLVLINPGFAAYTTEVYRQYDAIEAEPSDHTSGMLAALDTGSPLAVAVALGNALEPAAFKLYPKLTEIKNDLADLGLTPLLCGSGATVMGLARDKKQAAIAADRLGGKYPFVRAVTSR